jgi:ATP-dependent DNA helicase RecG
MTDDHTALRRLITSEEGQFFERKSLFEGPPGGKRQRDRRAVRDQVAEYVAAFANADGGTLVLGVEDDGTVTGCPYQDEDALAALLETPKTRLRPPLRPGRVVELDGLRLLVFDVAPSPTAVMVDGNGFPLREGDSTRQVSEEFINRTKEAGLVTSPEARMASGVTLDDLDTALVAGAMSAAGFEGTASEYLVQRRLADWRGETLVLRQAAAWLFAGSPGLIRHPNLGVRVFRVHGTEQKSGSERNVQDFPWIDDNLLRVLDQAKARIDSLIRKSSKLHDLFFRETPEYPTFAWQEGLVNALAHRDYADEGRCVEVYVYDDRIEVSSPGGLLPTVSLESLLARERVHCTRNPRMGRVLAELGMMRQAGEGIPRIIEEMELSWLPAPELDERNGCFRLVLRNEPIFQGGDAEWGHFVRELPLGVRLRRALVAFHDHAFQSADYQNLNRVDRDVAYRELQELEDRGLLDTEGSTRGRRYRVRKQVTAAEVTAGTPMARLVARMQAAGRITNADYREAFGGDREKATQALSSMVEAGLLEREGERRATRYVPGPKWPP